MISNLICRGCQDIRQPILACDNAILFIICASRQTTLQYHYPFDVRQARSICRPYLDQTPISECPPQTSQDRRPLVRFAGDCLAVLPVCFSPQRTVISRLIPVNRVPSSWWPHRLTWTTPPAQLSTTGKAARCASELLDLYSRFVPTTVAEAQTHRDLLDTAIESVLLIRYIRRLEAIVEMRSRDGVEPSEETKIDVACIVCCSRVADAVVLPCMHLALCMVCKLQMKGEI